MFASKTTELRIRRATPTVTEFVVTTRPTTFLTPSRILLHVLRTILVVAVILLLAVKYYVSFTTAQQQQQQQQQRHQQQWSAFSMLDDALSFICTALTGLVSRHLPLGVIYVSRLHWPYTLLIAAGGVWLASRRGYTEESLLILRGLGIQTGTSSGSYLSGTTYRFLPTTSIQDIFIHEGFVGFEVKFYLCVVVKGETEAVVVFPKLLPRRNILEKVWRGARSCLYEPQSLT